jgi:hypothetical protein
MESNLCFYSASEILCIPAQQIVHLQKRSTVDLLVGLEFFDRAHSGCKFFKLTLKLLTFFFPERTGAVALAATAPGPSRAFSTIQSSALPGAPSIAATPANPSTGSPPAPTIPDLDPGSRRRTGSCLPRDTVSCPEARTFEHCDPDSE